MKIISCQKDNELSQKIANLLNAPLDEIQLARFSGSEACISVGAVENQHICLVQTYSGNSNNDLMTLLISIDAAVRNKAKFITVFIPYFFYGRQDRQLLPNSSTTAKFIERILLSAGANQIITIDQHSNLPNSKIINLSSSELFAQHIKNQHLANLIIVSPDQGGFSRAETVANLLNLPVIAVEKTRIGKEIEVKVPAIINDKNCILIDDIIDSGKTLTKAAIALKEAGAKQIFAYCTHILSNNHTDLAKSLSAAGVITLYITNTIIPSNSVNFYKILDISSLIAKQIKINSI